eukprot:5458203-Prymnesium_polylepis.2
MDKTYDIQAHETTVLTTHILTTHIQVPVCMPPYRLCTGASRTQSGGRGGQGGSEGVTRGHKGSQGGSQ